MTGRKMSLTEDDLVRLGAEPVRRLSLGDEVYESLLARLFSLKIAPGARINIDALVKELGVSQTPLRGALVRLEADGLVEKKYHSGYSAAPLPGRHQLEQLYELRLLIEPVAAAKAAENAVEEDRVRMRSLHQMMSGNAGSDARLSYGKFALLDSQFHDLMARSGGADLIAETLARLHTHTHLFRLLYHSRMTEGALNEHAVLLDAVARRDPDAAHAAMRAHIEYSLDRLQPTLEMLD